MKNWFTRCCVFLSSLLCCAGWMTARGQSGGTLLFTENKGQWDGPVRFSADMKEGGFFLSGNGYGVLTRQTFDRGGQRTLASTHRQQADSITVKQYLYTVEFAGANPAPEVTPEKPTGAYNNYFIGKDPSKWSSRCRVFQGVTYKNLYPGIDVRYYTEAGSLKYNLIVHPGADLSQVRLQYKGASGLYTKGNRLHIGTPLGETLETEPVSYQPNDTGRTEVTCKYKVKGNTLYFDVPDYDPRNTLVIDPTFVFCSFTGSKGDNWGFTATYGGDGSMYLGGIAQTGYLTTKGSYSPGAAGPDNYTTRYPPDIAIIKLSADGTKELWATYLGGSTNVELPTSMIENANGDLIIGGHTKSSDFPTTVPPVGKPGGWDIFISRISNDGSTLMGSMVIGGSGQDGSNITDDYELPPGPQSLKQNYGDDSRGEVMLDGSGNVFMATCSRSGDFPTNGGFQTTNKGGATGQDGVVLKVNAAVNTLMWSTYLGGSGDDAVYVIDRSPITGQLYVGGGTASTDLPGVPSSGVIGPTAQTGYNGFVSILTDGGNTVTLDKTTYIGTGANDQVYGLKFDKLGFPYITGQTLSAAWPRVNAPYYITGAKNFICKLQPDLSAYVYSTVFGTVDAGAPNIVPVAFLVDRCENVYVSGWGGIVNTEDHYPSAGTDNLPITPGAYQTSTDNSDFYFFVMKKDAASQLYGSYFGQRGGEFQEHVDGGTSRFDQNGIIYQAICANCYGGAVFPTAPPNVWAPKNGTLGPGSLTGSQGGCNEAGVKIAFNLAGVGSGVKASIAGKAFSDYGCIPLLVNFIDTIGNGLTYEWNFGDGTPVQTTTVPATNHTYTDTGVYRIMLISIDSNSCNIADTSYTTIRAGSNKASPAFTYFKIPPCTDLTYQFTNTSTVVAGAKPFTDSSFIWNFGSGGAPVQAGLGTQTHAYPAAGEYTVELILVDTNYCNAPDTASITLHVAANVKAQFSTPPTGCVPYNAQFTDNSIGGMQWAWNFGDGATSTVESPTHLYTNTGNYTITLVVTDTSTCNKVDSTSETIQLFAKPTASFTWGPNPAVTNTPVVFTNNSSEDAVSFKWIFGDGDTLVTTSRDTVTHQYNATNNYNACLVAFNAAGCSDTTCQVVSAITIPDLDVPNAFTPGRFGQNGIIRVRGFAVATMDWKIYNRWGQLVFESQSLDDGWNGFYKGLLQPMDVYAYTLSVAFTDGTHAVKTGDITLLR